MFIARKKALANFCSDRGVLRQIQGYLLLLRIYSASEKEYRTQFESIEPDNKYQGFRLPRHPWVFRVYNYLSNVIVCWVFFKYFVPAPFAQVGKLFYSTFIGDNLQVLASHCYVFGRFVIYERISEESFGCLLASFHLSWRLTEWLLDRSGLLNVVVFLLQPEVDIRRFLHRLNSSTAYGRRNTLVVSSITGKITSVSIHSTLYVSNSSTHLTDHDLFLCHILCYKVNYPGLVVYRLRPNRTLEAHRRLVRWFSSATLWATLGFGLLALPITSYLIFIVHFNRLRYQNSYPNCNVQLSNPFQQQTDSSLWSTSLGSHHLASLAFDWLETSILWVDSGLALIYLLTFVYFLNRDLLIYWGHLDCKIRRMLLETRQKYAILNHHRHFGSGDTTDNSTMIMFGSFLSEEFELEVYQLQAELADFFRQINGVDLLLSDIFSHSLVIWLTTFGLCCSWAVEMYSNSGDAVGVFLLLACLFAFLGFSAAAISLLSLQRNCRLSYPRLCSLMAYDQSRYKRQFIEIINFYTNKNRTCYTLFHLYPFSSATFISIIGWSLTGYLVLDNFNHRRRARAGL